MAKSTIKLNLEYTISRIIETDDPHEIDKVVNKITVKLEQLLFIEQWEVSKKEIGYTTTP